MEFEQKYHLKNGCHLRACLASVRCNGRCKVCQRFQITTSSALERVQTIEWWTSHVWRTMTHSYPTLLLGCGTQAVDLHEDGMMLIAWDKVKYLPENYIQPILMKHLKPKLCPPNERSSTADTNEWFIDCNVCVHSFPAIFQLGNRQLYKQELWYCVFCAWQFYAIYDWDYGNLFLHVFGS